MARKTIKKKINFIIARQKLVKMIIEIENRRIIDLILYNTLHTSGLHSNLIFILKIYNLELEVYFRTNNIVAKFNDN